MDEISDDDLVSLISDVNLYGALHSILVQGNVEDDALSAVLEDSELDPEEQLVAQALLAVEDKRHRLALVERGTGSSFSWMHQ
jgi:hypothetical protein